MTEFTKVIVKGARHNYKKGWQLLDADMTGRPCGRKAAFASKGYFAKQRNRRGRQEGTLYRVQFTFRLRASCHYFGRNLGN